MVDQKVFVVEGVVLENLPNTMFRVKVTADNQGGLIDKTILAHLAGKMRRHFVRLLPGDRVQVEINPLDTERGRIVYRMR